MDGYRNVTDRRTDGRTDGQICYINIARQYADARQQVTRRAVGRAHVPPTKLFRRLAVNKTIIKPRVPAATGAAPNTYRCDFPDVIKFRVAAHTISLKAIRFRHPDYDPDRAQKLISSSMSRHRSTRNISSESCTRF